jgi:glycosyltransferase involved in cell wall biosynthesis
MQGGHFRFFYDHSNGFVREILSFLLNRCEKIFVQAERLKFQFNEVVPRNKIAVFYNFISKEFSDNFDAVDREHNGDINVLFVGHLTTAKGYCDLLKILPKLDGVRYTIIGSKGNARNVKFNQHTSDPLIYEDPEKIFQDYIGKNNLEGSVIFLGGNVNGKEKIQAFKEADIFALPSYSEGFSTAIVEGMTAGLPIIATSVGAAPEIIEDGVNGYIVNPGDLSALQMRIQELSNNKELRLNMGRHNLLLSKEKFSTDNVIKNLKVELQAIIARN